MASKRRLSDAQKVNLDDPVDPDDELLFVCLGGGNEVGRSCHIIEYKGKTIMLDAGSHAGREGMSALPYFDAYDLSKVDILLISHFHIDHAASVPYVLSKTNFRGRVFMTHPTKAIYKWLIQDAVRVNNASSSSESRSILYTEQDHFMTFPRIEAIDFNTTHTVNSIRFTPYPAGHVLGAAMFLIEIAGLNILYTGDYSREEDRHLITAKVPKNVKIDLLITESTFGIASHVPRQERETALMKSITTILNRGGRVLMPIAALGRVQELFLILDEYWAKHPEYQQFPIYYASNLAKRCMGVYQTYLHTMNDNIKRITSLSMDDKPQAKEDTEAGAWDLKFVRSLRNLDKFDDTGGCIVLAAPGMLQSGASRELLERWAPSEKNGVLITGYNVEGTMAKDLLMEPDQIPSIMGNRGSMLRAGRAGLMGEVEKPMIPRKCTIQEINFAAHVDGTQNREFIEEVGAPVVILVHGEKHNMNRLKSKLLSLNADKVNKTKIFSPLNAEELRIPFRTEKTAKVVGKLAQEADPTNDEVEDSGADKVVAGVLVQNDFKYSLMAPEDLREYAGLNTTMIMCKQRLTLSSTGIGLVKWALAGMFGALTEVKPPAPAPQTETSEDEKVEEVERTGPRTFVIMDRIYVHCDSNGEVNVEWEGNPLNDGLADSVVSVLLTVESTPAAVMMTSKTNGHHHHDHAEDKDIPIDARNPYSDITSGERLERVLDFLTAQFGEDNITQIKRPKMPESETSTKAQLQPQNTSDTSKPLPNGSGSPKIKPEPTEQNADDIKPDPETQSTALTLKRPADEDDDADAEEDIDPLDLEAMEMERLISLGIPVPGIEISIDKLSAKVWFETLEVESSNAVLRKRVKAVVDRAVETVAPLSSA